MENGVMIYENPEFGSVRTIEENGNVLFCGRDVAKALGYVRPQNAIKAHCRWALKRGITDSLGRERQTIFLPEGDLYRLITHSKLPTAEKFERWVFDEVIPAIRRQGYYAIEGRECRTLPSTESHFFRQPDEMLQLRRNCVNYMLTTLERTLGLSKNSMLHQSYETMETEGWIRVDEVRQHYIENGGEPDCSALDAVLMDKEAFRELYEILERNMELLLVKHFH